MAVAVAAVAEQQVNACGKKKKKKQQQVHNISKSDYVP